MPSKDRKFLAVTMKTFRIRKWAFHNVTRSLCFSSRIPLFLREETEGSLLRLYAFVRNGEISVSNTDGCILLYYSMDFFRS